MHIALYATTGFLAIAVPFAVLMLLGLWVAAVICFAVTTVIAVIAGPAVLDRLISSTDRPR